MSGWRVRVCCGSALIVTIDVEVPTELTDAQRAAIEALAAADTATSAQSRNDARARKDESVTIPEGATASGLGGRYAEIRRTVHTTLRMLDYQGKIDGPTSYDTGTAAASPTVREMFTKDHVAALPSGARAAFQARLQPLAEQWGTYVRMTAVGG